MTNTQQTTVATAGNKDGDKEVPMGETLTSELAPGEGPSLIVPAAELMTFKWRGAEGDAYSIVEDANQGPYEGPPPHIHLRQDESFYVAQGEFVFVVEDREIPASAGAFLRVPKGTVHAWRNVGTGIGKLVMIFSPAGDVERFFEEIGEPTTTKTPPMPPTEPPDPAAMEMILASAERNHIVGVPPPPGG